MNIEARQEDLGSSARQLAAAAEPVFIFDGKSPVVVWANAAALAFVGHAAGPGAQLPHFDRAMPAMTFLRAMSEQDVPPAGVRTDLVFWTPAGARSLACVCRRATFAFAPEALIVHGVASPREPALETEVAASAPERTRTRKPRTTAKIAANGKRNSKTPRRVRGRRKPTFATAPNPVAQPLASPPPSTHTMATVAPDVAAQPPSADALALREIARQITSATSIHMPGSAGDQVPVFRHSEADHNAGEPVVAHRTAAQQNGISSPGKAEFLAQVSHEIRTPLNSILGFAEIMREERFGAIGNARYKTYAADIHESAAHALSLINDLLDLSRIEAGGLQLEPEQIDVAQAIAQATSSMRPIADKAGIILSAPTGRPLPRLVCDARSLKQMLLNLVSNAIRHTDPGGAVWMTAATDDDGGLAIRVQDTGVGMRPEEITLALEPYTQVGPAGRRSGGTGLGLPLTKAMAQANGGRLQLERVAGGGLAALLLFPADRLVRT